ncbi:mandelate racemase/muconate lactonizing enzyme family protein [Actinopolymorpha rutila]|uniref:L-alanine-DL-glutamate epimerase-like enolase superfamily enzyme n=1 Tax=Actinopolymorpha rutila TaxID=446787 RepID=A0A852ZFV1_9ACTN|nr:mandelate racemase/muconate lactonizing enzyme family protein [Actinopolymorpha rutila]NYH92051.1 L-alanine-DL-glutamate epimerase-like enolase superfamily enzyme [Actinopolymorpha rutila]
MRVKEVRTTYSVRPHAARPIRDALQTLTGGGSVSVEVESEDGLVGRGTSSFGRIDGAPKALSVFIDGVLAPLVVGRDATGIPAIIESLKVETEYHGTAGFATFGISAVDVALWDLLGKAHGVPTYQLWGAHRDRVPAYAMVGWSNYDLDELRQQCGEAVAQGFRGVKIKVGAGDLDDDVRRIEAVRSRIGPDVALMVDANQVLTLSEALRRGEVFGELGVTWFEEPLPAQDFAGYAELTSRLRIPVAAGENLYGAGQFREFFERRGCDIVQPDLRRAGGPTEIRAVGALASAFGVPYASHGGGPAALSLLLCAPTAIWLETGLRSSPTAYPRLEDGCALAPQGPGFEWE